MFVVYTVGMFICWAWTQVVVCVGFCVLDLVGDGLLPTAGCFVNST